MHFTHRWAPLKTLKRCKRTEKETNMFKYLIPY